MEEMSIDGVSMGKGSMTKVNIVIENMRKQSEENRNSEMILDEIKEKIRHL